MVLLDFNSIGALFLTQSRPYSAGDAALRQQTRPPVKLTTTCVGGSPVDLVDASVSVQTSISGRSSTSTEFDGEEEEDPISMEDEVDDVQTTTTTAAAMGVVTTTVTTTTKKRTNLNAVQKRRSRFSRHCVINSPEMANNVGLDVEMRHVAKMEELVRVFLVYFLNHFIIQIRDRTVFILACGSYSGSVCRG